MASINAKWYLQISASQISATPRGRPVRTAAIQTRTTAASATVLKVWKAIAVK